MKDSTGTDLHRDEDVEYAEGSREGNEEEQATMTLAGLPTKVLQRSVTLMLKWTYRGNGNVSTHDVTATGAGVLPRLSTVMTVRPSDRESAED